MAQITDEISQLRDKVLALYPIGSKWYDCANDSTGVVELHFPPRGIILEDGPRRLRRLRLSGSADRTVGRAADRGPGYHEYRAAQAQVRVDYKTLFGNRTVWGRPASSAPGTGISTEYDPEKR
jgi:hypothetical protein